VEKYCRAGQATDEKATNAHSEYVILIAFPLQQWLQERTWMLRYSNTLHVLLLRSTRSRDDLRGSVQNVIYC
jgi:hypothetical protein